MLCGWEKVPQKQPKWRGESDQAVVLCVAADPHPENSAFHVRAEGAIPQAHADGPPAPYPLEVKRRMVWILAQQFVAPVREVLNLNREAVQKVPERG